MRIPHIIGNKILIKLVVHVRPGFFPQGSNNMTSFLRKSTLSSARRGWRIARCSFLLCVLVVLVPTWASRGKDTVSPGSAANRIHHNIVRVRAMFQSQSYMSPWEQPYVSSSPEVFGETAAFAVGLCISTLTVNGSAGGEKNRNLHMGRRRSCF